MREMILETLLRYGLYLNLILQNWLAYENYSSSWAAKESHKLVFLKSEVPAAENNYALCMVSVFCLISITLEFMLKIRVGLTKL